MLRLLLTAAILPLGALYGLAADVPLGTMPLWTTSEQNVVSTGMIWRDCNRDGLIDAFFSNGNDIERALNNIYLGEPGGMPPSASWYSSNGEYSGHCAVGDVNDDGYPDLMVANYLGTGFNDPNRSDLYLNQGGLPGGFPVWYTPDELYSFSCAFGDVDNDGDLDVAFAAGEGYYARYQANRIYRNDGGVFTDAASWTAATAAASLDVAWGDVDRDGDLDLAFTGDAQATCVYYNNAGVVETNPSWLAATVESGNTVVFGDINGDDWLDLVVAYNNQLNGQGRFRVYFNNGDGTLNQVHGWQSATGGYGSALALCDYDNDGDDDLAAGRWFENLWVYENLGQTLTTSPVWTSAIEVVAEELAWVDIDGAGVLSLADTLLPDGPRKLFYLRHHPLYEIDSVVVDGVSLDYGGYCYDLVSGWLSLAVTPVSEAVCFYRYSFQNDLAVANWDTVNMVFGNTAAPFVDVSAENTFGPVPLTVAFSDHSVGAIAWNWDFGDGSFSDERNPTHAYHQPGYYDVGVDITTAERILHRIVHGMVSAYADTLVMQPAELLYRKARVEVGLRNHLPLSEIVIPFTWAGSFNLRFDSISVSGLRTQYFDTHSLISLVPATKSATVHLACGAQPALAPGNAPVVSLHFTDIGTGASGSSPIAFTSYYIYSPTLTTLAGDYAPRTVDGLVYVDCCEGRVGDANAAGGDEPTLGDIVVIIDMLFITGTPVACLAEADIDQSGGPYPPPNEVSIGDIAALIDYLFVTGPSVGLRDCQ